MNENVTTKCRIGEVRLSYVHIFQPEATAEGGEKKYSVSLIIPKTNKALLNEIKVAIEAAKQAGVAKFGGKVPVNLKTPLRDGDLERPDDDAYAGCYFINASSRTKPGVVKRMKVNGQTVMVEVTNEEDVYSGCYGFASVNFFAFNTSGNKGIAAGLNNVLKTRDGEYLGGRASAQTDFGDINLEEYDDLGDDFPD
jgi:hypothetical protein